ncbi:MAG: type IV secretion system DNA-binding domain-containing protein [Candidatus Harrisonbacteria bacterium]|nr:type IV secretion system DNA-binding domain-containing protein [Candidatus Harrisonbacteria bacterium]
MIKDEITPFGIINFRNRQIEFGIKMDDRRRHMYVVGKTGMGKTTFLENMVIADILSGRGVGVVDPHGEFAEKLLDFVPAERIKDVVYIDPSDMNYPIAFNPLEQVGTEFRHLVASGIMGVFKKIWVDLWSARMEYILNNTLLALLEYPGSTLLGIMRMLNDKDYRKKVVDSLKDPVVKGFWVNEFAKYSQKFETEATAAIQNKVGQFVTNPLIRNILGQSRSSIDMRKIMDEGKILIVNLSKGKIGEDNSALLGALIITKLQLAAMSRVDIPESARKDFYLYVDEFQNFATDSFANILSEARKYRLCLILAHQYIRQLVHDTNTKVRDAIFGNVGTIVSYRIGAEDAEFLEKEFQPDFMANDFVNLPKHNFYIKLLIDGISSRPFSATGISPYKIPDQNFKDVIIENSRREYSTPKKIVEEKIAGEWMAGGERAAEEKISRKGELPLIKVLKPIDSFVGSPERRKSLSSRPPKPFSGVAPKETVPTMPKPVVPVIPKPAMPEVPKQEKKKVDITDLKSALAKALSSADTLDDDFEDMGEQE